MQMHPQRLGTIYTNVSTDGVCVRYKVWLCVCEYDMNRIMMFKVLMKANVSTEVGYNIRCGCGCVGKDRRGYSDISPLHATNKQ